MVHTVIKGQNFNLLNDVLIKLGQMINLVSYFPKGHLHLLGMALCHYQLLYFVDCPLLFFLCRWRRAVALLLVLIRVNDKLFFFHPIPITENYLLLMADTIR